MTLDPRDRKSWHGLFDVFQPPSGYRLSAALGTSFGLSLDALVAALLAMGDADPDSLASEPLAGVMAATRLGSRVRVLVHPGTISGPSQPGSNRFVALLDRMIVEVKPSVGLFHPKVWALRFEKVGYGRPSEPQFRGRLVVSSRNLGPSSSFELGTILDGQPASRPIDASPFSIDVADALANWLTAGKKPVPAAVQQMPAFIRSLQLDIPSEGADECRLRWQGADRSQLVAVLPKRFKRVLVVSPFVQSDFVATLVARSDQLQLVGMREAIDALDDGTVSSMEGLAPRKGLPAIYHVTDLQDPDDPEGGYIDGVHAKALIAEEESGASVTFVGSANATGPGWGLSGSGNVEAMVEMRPGIGIDQFVSAFIRESKAKLHPWIAEYDRSDKADVDPKSEMERILLRALREAATLKFAVAYDGDAQRLRLSVQLPTRAQWLSEPGCDYFAAPLLLADRPDAWTRLRDLASASRLFDATPIEQVTSFVAIRATSKNPPMERTRLALARLDLAEDALNQRDEAIRHEIVASADPAAVLNALVKGLAFLPSGVSGTERAGWGNESHTLQQVLADASLERLLQAVALQPDLVQEMRQLLGSLDGPFRQLCDDLEHVVARVRDEATA
jgi:hypothetical protein